MKDEIHPLTAYLSKFIQLSQEEKQAIHFLVPIKQYSNGTLLLTEGQVSTVSYFNIKGCVKMYFLVDGVEKITYFYTENQFIASMNSFVQQLPSDHYLECIEDCLLVPISFQIEQNLMEQFPKLESISRMILEREVGHYQQMLATFIRSKPEDRYLNLLQNRPDLIQRVPQYQLATYLGIQPESLSRIKKRLAQRDS